MGSHTEVSSLADLTVEGALATISRMARASVEVLLLNLSVQRVQVLYESKLILWIAKFGLDGEGSLSGLTHLSSGRTDVPSENSHTVLSVTRTWGLLN